ncbi:SPOR domain-containing protein [Utexia brackfieldae]|uniref:SPOR domain-containing protein n=1 Tax=Utexia brackfieldae TaxID=3074108 RepID=UPI00370D9541
MAQRDYVRKKKGSSKQNHSRVIPKLMMVIGIILIVLFVAILYVISKNRSDSKPVTNVQKPVSKPEVLLPEKPQERWAYLKQLENPDGEKDIRPQNQTTASEREQILNSFRNEASSSNSVKPAGNKTAQVSAPSKTVETTPPKSSTNTKWAIQCGAFKDKSNAESQRARIAMSGIESKVQSASLYRVIVGSEYGSKAQAETIVAQLKHNGINNCIISNK